MKHFIYLSICILTLNACKEKSKLESSDKLFETIPQAVSGLDFVNTIIEDEDINYLHYGYIYNGSGVAAGDVNNDGLTDLYFSSNLEFNKLYLNLGNFKFKDITESAGVNGGDGYKSGVTMADVNNDGWLDIFVCKTAIKDSLFRKKMLYINNQDGTFTDKISEMGLDDRSYTTQAYFFDSDQDGDLDVYFVNHPMNFEDNNYIKPIVNNQKSISKESKFTSDRFYVNVNGKFMDKTKEANILNEAFGLSAVIGDFNNDRKQDVYVANDFLQPDFLFINQGNNTFKESFSEYFQHCPFSSMGTDYADINNDGCYDLMIVDMTPLDPIRQKNLLMTQNYDRFQLMLESGLKAQYSINSLQLGSCGESFSDLAFLTGTAYTDWSWSPLIADFDNDGNKDIFVTNGYLHDVMHSDYNRYKLDSLEKLYNAGLVTKMQWINNMPSVKIKDFFFKNMGNLKFEDRSEEWNSGPSSFSHGAAYSDLDNDGDLDLIVCNVNDPVTLLKNNASGDYIRFQFKEKINCQHQGASIILTLNNDKKLFGSLQQTRGFLSKSEDFVHFGIVKGNTVQTVEIKWPDNTYLKIPNPKINTVHTIDKTKGESIKNNPGVQAQFSQVNISQDFYHKENSFIDFKREPLLIHKLSEEGPTVCTGDINGDNLTDLYFGGAKSFPGKLLVQNQDGSFQSILKNLFEIDKTHEDVASIFIDVNSDKLLDLYVVSGGNESDASSADYQDRIYINKGNLNFIRDNSILPTENLSGSCIDACDIDKDGDIDLFIGSRSVPGRYGQAPEHLLLINEKGIFKNEIISYSQELNSIGMITAAKWFDLDNDGSEELILCGEFTPVSIFSIQQKKLINRTKEFGLDERYGLWQSLLIEDMNGDNYKDIIVGNLGMNSHIKADSKNQLQLIYSDFDKNGSLDAILCRSSNSKLYPIHYRDRVLDQMVFLKKKYTRFEPYSTASIEDIFSAENRNNMKTLKANTSSSVILLNKQGKSFETRNLPIECQFSVLQSSIVIDYNKDGKKDLITAGNFYGTDAQFGRYDASTGCLLQGDGNGNFKYLPHYNGGIHITGDIRELSFIQSKKYPAILVSRNNSQSYLLKY
ncbi:MAG: VCBS repeat-containing protein [Saprospiraceae bacterium]|nr:VCBS repeat-containing protein [Saprospiraceae bacterium]